MDMRTKDIEKLSGKVEGLSRLQGGGARENNCRKVDACFDMAYRGMAAPAGVRNAYLGAGSTWR